MSEMQRRQKCRDAQIGRLKYIKLRISQNMNETPKLGVSTFNFIFLWRNERCL
jgi:hypothetical protein